jgi:NSS family neurotransmitter:Na+ symporter
VTSMVGLIEPLTHWSEERWGFSRHKSALLILGTISVLSIFSVLSYNLLAAYQWFGKDLNALADFVSNQIFLPIGGMLIAIFAGWFVDQAISREELDLPEATYKIWQALIRFVVPPAIFIVFVLGIGLI